MTDPGRKPNRLIHEKSPYLLQHAHNPVDWHPWGAEAMAKARKEDKPIFLSIGYSTCYWCHVMEQESFEDAGIAELLNAHFVPIKVDREERPDLDAFYMSAVQAMSGQGGWPMSVFLTPDGKPFWGGTYFPPTDKWGRPGFRTVLVSLDRAWKTKREELLKSSAAITEALQAARPPAAEPLTMAVLDAAAAQFADQYDSLHGGFGGAPKFPRTHALSCVLRLWFRQRDEKLLQMVTHTLDVMARGGIHDQLGGGFHRYATDAIWRVPHFEKMLYDQALISRAYLEAYQATGHAEYAETCRDIFSYVLRDMRDPQGAFYSAEDAGEVGKEGEFYVWTPEQLREALGPDDAALISQVFGVTEGGNFEHGTSVLERQAGPIDVKLQPRIDAAKQKLLAARDKRTRPHRDDKILTDWNGLMIGALAYGGRALDDPRYTDAATQAAEFILTRMRAADGGLLHRYRDGQAAINGFLDDYAFFAWGLLELHQTTQDPRWLREAQQLTREMLRLFGDDAGGGFFITGKRHEALVAKTKELYDGALPSGNSVAGLVLVQLAQLTMDRELREAAERQLQTFAAAVRQAPSAFPQFVIALDQWLGPSQEIVIAGEPQQAVQMVQMAQRRFLPRALIVLHPPGRAGEAIESLIPFVKAQQPIKDQPTAYLCQQFVCTLPVTDPAELARRLDAVR